MKRPLSTLLTLLFLATLATPSWATITRTVCPSGCDETTLNAAVSWFESTYPNLVSETQIGEIVISGDWTSTTDTTPVTIDSIGTNSSYYLHIYTTGDALHDGTWSGNAKSYKLVPAAENNGIVVTNTDYVDIEGLKISVSGTTAVGDKGGIRLSHGATNGHETIHGNIVKGVISGSGSWYVGISLFVATSGTVSPNIYNNIVYDFVNSTNSNYGFRAAGSGATVTVNTYNNTFHNTHDGVVQGYGTVNSYNNGFASVTNAYGGTVGGKTGDSTSTPTFVNEGSDDFHLQSSDTTWKDQTSDQSSGLFSDDIDGETRTGSWDIGADEYVAAGGGGGQVIMYSSLFLNHWR